MGFLRVALDPNVEEEELGGWAAEDEEEEELCGGAAEEEELCCAVDIAIAVAVAAVWVWDEEEEEEEKLSGSFWAGAEEGWTTFRGRPGPRFFGSTSGKDICKTLRPKKAKKGTKKAKEV